MSEQATRVSFVNSRASVWLDALRGIAAVMVTFEHVRQHFFLDPADLKKPSIAVRALYELGGFGHAAVMVFFVLSGFLVGGSVIRAREKNNWAWGTYLVHRLVRLWIVLLPALVLGLFWDLGQIHVAHSKPVCAFIAQRAFETADRLSVSGFLGNAVFLQEIVVRTLGSNAALWSLTYEFWYYLMFPLGFFAIFPYYTAKVRWMFLAGLMAVGFWVGWIIDLYAPLWLFGALLFYVRRPAFSRRARVVALAVYLVLMLALRHFSFRFPFTGDYLVALVTCALLWSLLSDTAAADAGSLPTRAFRLLARFSYSLYLINLPVFNFAAAVLLRKSKWDPSPRHLAAAFAVWAATLLLALGVASLTEFRTDSVRRWVETRWLHRRLAKPAMAG